MEIVIFQFSKYKFVKFERKKRTRPDVRERMKKLWHDARQAGFANLAQYKKYHA